MADKSVLLGRANGCSVFSVPATESRSQWAGKKGATRQPHGGKEWGGDLNNLRAPRFKLPKCTRVQGKR